MKKIEQMTSYDSELPVSTLVQECLDWSGMKAAQFSQEVGFADATRIYGALNQNRDLGVTSFNAILRRFPLLNGDRFVRKSGPLLLSDLCDKQESKNIIQEVKPVIANGNDWQMIADERLRTIERLEKQNDMLLKMLDK